MLHPIFQQIFESFWSLNSNLSRPMAELPSGVSETEDKEPEQDLDDLGGEAA